MNRKAQETTPLSNIAGVIIIVAIVVILLTLAFNAYGKGKTVATSLPSDLTSLVTACNGYVSSSITSTQVDYCKFREITLNGVDQYINCANPAVQGYMDSQNRGVFNCNSDSTNPPEKQECITLFKQGIKNPLVVGGLNVNCANPATNTITPITCNDLGGVVSAFNKACPAKNAAGQLIGTGTADQTRAVNGYNAGAEKDSVCCVVPLSA